jgi:endoglycosylceramidase
VRLIRFILGPFIALFLFVPAADAAQLTHEGRWITDARGRVHILHGWNVVSKVGSQRPEDTGFGRDDARFLKRNGFNTIRLGVIYGALEPEPPAAGGPPRYAEGYLRSIERTQRMLAKYGIQTLLDFHQDLYNEKFQGEGWPDWQVLDTTPVGNFTCPNELRQGFPNNYVVNAGLNCAFDSFWANRHLDGTGLQDRYAAAWRHVAQRFRGAPKLLGYNIINEPWPGSMYPTCLSPTGCPAFDTQTLEPFSERVISEIREVDQRSLAWYAPLVVFDFGADSSHGAIGNPSDGFDPNTGFAFNMYCLAGGFLPANPAGDASCGETYEITLDNADKQADETGDALLMTEYGATNDLNVVNEVIDRTDAHMIGWQQWHYCECDDPTTAGSGIQSVVRDPRQPPRGENLNRGKLEATARPYPQVVSGTPLGWDWDGEAKIFDFSYETIAPGGERLGRRSLTKIFLPRIQYPEGYEVEVSGARVVGGVGRRVLRLKRGRRAAEVQVQVIPPQ